MARHLLDRPILAQRPARPRHGIRTQAERWEIAGEWPLARDVGNGNGSSLATLTLGTRGSPLNVLSSPDGEVLVTQNGAIQPQRILDPFAPYLEL